MILRETNLTPSNLIDLFKSFVHFKGVVDFNLNLSQFFKRKYT